MCGISGVYAKDGECSIKITKIGFGLISALDHRGKESCGMSCDRGDRITTIKGLGSPSEAISIEWLNKNPSRANISQLRYSTTGSGSTIEERESFAPMEDPDFEFSTRNTQPLFCQTLRGTFSLAHNGNLTNAAALKKELEAEHVEFFSEVDSEVILKLICFYLLDSQLSIQDAIAKTMLRLTGSYSCILLSKEGMFAFRDPYGNRPLKIAETPDYYILVSESCAWHKYEAAYISSVGEGEIVTFSKEGIERVLVYRASQLAHCIFENIYFKSPNTNLTSEENRQGGNGTVAQFRKKLGMKLAIEHPFGSGIVIPLMDTGQRFAEGYQFIHEEQQRLVRGRSYLRDPWPKDKSAGRSFIESNKKDREAIIRRKYFNLFDTIRDEIEVIIDEFGIAWLIFVDDSLVRSTTSHIIIKRIREIIVRMFPDIHQKIKFAWLVGSPPLKFPCYYGTDIANIGELVAANMTMEQIREIINVDYLGYLSLEALREVIGKGQEHFCQACFTGVYSIPFDIAQGKMDLAT